MSELKLEWDSDPKCREADFCNGLLTLRANNMGWSILDGYSVVEEGVLEDFRDQAFYASCRAAELALQHRLRMAAETLDSSWLEAEREEEELVLPEPRLFGIPAFDSMWRCRVYGSDGVARTVEVPSEALDAPNVAGAEERFRILGDKLRCYWFSEPEGPQKLGEFDQGDVIQLLTTGSTEERQPLYHFTAQGLLKDGKPVEQSGYDQILSSIRAEAKEVKL